jgi:hypothetical protein
MGNFSVDHSIEEERFKRQGGRCALCGKRLVLENYEKGEENAWASHHIDGDSSNNVIDNCAVVCINEPENCHLNSAHTGDFSFGVLAPKSWFHLDGWAVAELKLIERE